MTWMAFNGCSYHVPMKRLEGLFPAEEIAYIGAGPKRCQDWKWKKVERMYYLGESTDPRFPIIEIDKDELDTLLGKIDRKGDVPLVLIHSHQESPREVTGGDYQTLRLVKTKNQGVIGGIYSVSRKELFFYTTMK